MTPEEKAALNRRVAVAFGWEVKQGATGWRWFKDQIPVSDTRPTKGSAERHVPDFATDPAAADLVLQEIERRGWDINTSNETRRGTRSYSAEVNWQGAIEKAHRQEGRSVNYESPYTALCLAFLAAVDAEGGGRE